MYYTLSYIFKKITTMYFHTHMYDCLVVCRNTDSTAHTYLPLQEWGWEGEKTIPTCVLFYNRCLLLL